MMDNVKAFAALLLLAAIASQVSAAASTAVQAYAFDIQSTIINFITSILHSIFGAIFNSSAGGPGVNTTTITNGTMQHVGNGCVAVTGYACSNMVIAANGTLSLTFGQNTGGTDYNPVLSCSNSTHSSGQHSTNIGGGKPLISGSAIAVSGVQCPGASATAPQQGYLWLSYSATQSGYSSEVVVASFSVSPTTTTTVSVSTTIRTTVSTTTSTSTSTSSTSTTTVPQNSPILCKKGNYLALGSGLSCPPAQLNLTDTEIGNQQYETTNAFVNIYFNGTLAYFNQSLEQNNTPYWFTLSNGHLLEVWVYQAKTAIYPVNRGANISIAYR